MLSRSRDNNSYAFTSYANVNRNYAVNGLNQYTSAGGASFTYDPNGNLTSDGSNSYLYDIENRLFSRSGAGTASLRYDPLGRLYEVTGSSGTKRARLPLYPPGVVVSLIYDGDVSSSPNLPRRFAFHRGDGIQHIGTMLRREACAELVSVSVAQCCYDDPIV